VVYNLYFVVYFIALSRS